MCCRCEMTWMSTPSIMFELYPTVEVILFYLYCWIVSFGWNPIHTVMTEKISGCCTQKESHMDHMLQKDVQLRSISPGEPWSGSRNVSHSDRNDQSLAERNLAELKIVWGRGRTFKRCTGEKEKRLMHRSIHIQICYRTPVIYMHALLVMRYPWEPVMLWNIWNIRLTSKFQQLGTLCITKWELY